MHFQNSNFSIHLSYRIRRCFRIIYSRNILNEWNIICMDICFQMLMSGETAKPIIFKKTVPRLNLIVGNIGQNIVVNPYYG